MAIAGFAANTGEPFLSDMAGEITRGIPSYTDINQAEWAENVVRTRLELFRIINSVEGGPPERLDTFVTLASIGTNGIPKIVHMAFEATRGNRPTITTFAGSSFQLVASGVTQISNSVAAGSYVGSNRTLVKFLKTRRLHQEENLSVQQMSKVASALIKETSKMSSMVGGDTQIGMFEVDKEPIWKQENFDANRPILGQLVLYCDSINPQSPPISSGIVHEVVNVWAITGCRTVPCLPTVMHSFTTPLSIA